MTSTRIRIFAVAAGAMLAGTALAGCGGGGGNSTDAYCKDIKQATKSFGALGKGDYAKLDAAFATFHKLAAESPSKISGDWKVLDGALTTMQKAFKDAGINFKDLGKIQQGQVPEGLDVTKLSKLTTTLSTFDDAKFKTASDNISAHAKSVCKVDITS